MQSGRQQGWSVRRTGRESQCEAPPSSSWPRCASLVGHVVLVFTLPLLCAFLSLCPEFPFVQGHSPIGLNLNLMTLCGSFANTSSPEKVAFSDTGG